MAEFAPEDEFTPGSREWYAARLYGQKPAGDPADIAAANRNTFATEAAYMAPVTGETLSAKDAWEASGRGGQALAEGRYRDAVGDYGNLLLGVLGVVPGVGMVARGTQRGAAWMDRNLPKGVNAFFDALAPNDAKNTAAIFGGPSSKTANLVAMRRAEEMERNGHNSDEIRLATGWERNADGKWSYEISDKAAKLKDLPQYQGLLPEGGPKELRAGRMEDFVDHPELYEAYPDIAHSHVQIHDDMGDYYGMHSIIGEGPNAWENFAFSPKGAESVNTPLHELQHGVSHREGFSSGSNPNAFSPEAVDDFRQTISANPVTAEKLNKLDPKQRDERLRHQLYRRVRDEVRARNTVERKDMDATERRLVGPEDTEDVLRSMQIDPPRQNAFAEPQTSAASAPPDWEPGYFHGTTTAKNFKRFKPGSSPASNGAAFVTTDEEFARLFADGKRGRVLPVELNKAGFADLTKAADIDKIAAILAKKTGKAPEQMREQITARIRDGRLDWAYRDALDSVREAGFSGVLLKDAYDVPSVAVFDMNRMRITPKE